jgi:hypothetical protein
MRISGEEALKAVFGNKKFRRKASAYEEQFQCKRHKLSLFKCRECNPRMRDRCEHGIVRANCSRCGGPELIARVLFYKAKGRAKKSGIIFKLTVESIYQMVLDTKGVCPIFGVKLILGGGRQRGRTVDNAPSLDRHNNLKGYTKENCFVISNRANRIKSNCSAEELRRLADYAETGK